MSDIYQKFNSEMTVMQSVTKKLMESGEFMRRSFRHMLDVQLLKLFLNVLLPNMFPGSLVDSLHALYEEIMLPMSVTGSNVLHVTKLSLNLTVVS